MIDKQSDVGTTELVITQETSRQEARRALWHRCRKVGAGVISAAMLGTIGETVYVYVTDPPDRPSMHVLQQDIPVCKELDRLTVYSSGTGRETAEFAASVNHRLVMSFGSCSAYLKYGHEYDAAESAQVFVDAIRDLTPEGEVKQVFLSGPSFGAIAWEDIISQEVVRKADFIVIAGIAMEATPMDIQDVKEEIFGIPVQSVPVSDVVPFGRLALLANNINELSERKQMGDWQQWCYLFENTFAERPPLTRSQLMRLRQGIGPIRDDVQISYIHSSDDKTVFTQQALAKLRRLTSASITEMAIHGGGHAALWQDFKYEAYREPYRRALTGAFGKPT